LLPPEKAAVGIGEHIFRESKDIFWKDWQPNKKRLI